MVGAAQGLTVLAEDSSNTLVEGEILVRAGVDVGAGAVGEAYQQQREPTASSVAQKATGGADCQVCGGKQA